MPAKGRQPLTKEQLEKLAAELKARATILNYLAKKMTAKQVIEVMNLPMVERGMDSLDRFILNCKRELGEL